MGQLDADRIDRPQLFVVDRLAADLFERAFDDAVTGEGTLRALTSRPRSWRSWPGSAARPRKPSKATKQAKPVSGAASSRPLTSANSAAPAPVDDTERPHAKAYRKLTHLEIHAGR